MEALPKKQLIRMALITAPLIAITYCTPFYIFQVLPNVSYFVILPIFTMPILLAWFLNLLFLFLFDKPWIKTLWRTLIICLLMFVVSGFVLYLVQPPFPIAPSYVTLVRGVNIVSVNLIIYILIDLTLTKEKKNRVELENANLRIATLEAEYKLLKDQINPHFLFNALSTAKALVKNEPGLAEEYIVRLSDFLRASINNDHKTVTLKEELELCKSFVGLNQIRFGTALQVEYSLPAELSGKFVPYFSIVSLLENAVKHNSLTSESPLKIAISLQGDVIEVRNNKNPKFLMETPSKTGLTNLSERYRLISGKEVQVKENDHEYCVQIPVLKE